MGGRHSHVTNFTTKALTPEQLKRKRILMKKVMRQIRKRNYLNEMFGIVSHQYMELLIATDATCG